MTRRRSVALLVVLCAMAAACSAPGAGSGRPSGAGVHVTHYDVDGEITPVTSEQQLVASTMVAVIATAESVVPDPASGRLPRSLVTLRVDTVLRGSPGARILVSEFGGQPRQVIDGLVPIRMGQRYMLLLGPGPQAGQYAVLGGDMGLFTYDQRTMVVTRVEPAESFVPQTVSLDLVKAMLGTPEPTTTVPPVVPIPGACPPGCSLSGDDDAITWLASQSDSVTIVTAHASASVAAAAGLPVSLTIDQVLEKLGPLWSFTPGENFIAPALVAGQEYLVFASQDRGGPCMSTLYSYDPQDQTATLVGADRMEIPLPGLDLPLPRSLSLYQVRERMYPVAPYEQSTDL